MRSAWEIPAQAELGRGTLVSKMNCDGLGHPPKKPPRRITL
jgi:hypothetical protein